MRRRSRAHTLSHMRTHTSNTSVHVKDFILILITYSVSRSVSRSVSQTVSLAVSYYGRKRPARRRFAVSLTVSLAVSLAVSQRRLQRLAAASAAVGSGVCSGWQRRLERLAAATGASPKGVGRATGDGGRGAVSGHKRRRLGQGPRLRAVAGGYGGGCSEPSTQGRDPRRRTAAARHARAQGRARKDGTPAGGRQRPDTHAHRPQAAGGPSPNNQKRTKYRKSPNSRKPPAAGRPDFNPPAACRPDFNPPAVVLPGTPTTLRDGSSLPQSARARRGCSRRRRTRGARPTRAQVLEPEAIHPRTGNCRQPPADSPQGYAADICGVF